LRYSVLLYKMVPLVLGTNLVRKELGVPTK
jgi:hypothetical protein